MLKGGAFDRSRQGLPTELSGAFDPRSLVEKSNHTFETIPFMKSTGAPYILQYIFTQRLMCFLRKKEGRRDWVQSFR